MNLVRLLLLDTQGVGSSTSSRATRANVTHPALQVQYRRPPCQQLRNQTQHRAGVFTEKLSAAPLPILLRGKADSASTLPRLGLACRFWRCLPFPFFFHQIKDSYTIHHPPGLILSGLWCSFTRLEEWTRLLCYYINSDA